MPTTRLHVSPSLKACLESSFPKLLPRAASKPGDKNNFFTKGELCTRPTNRSALRLSFPAALTGVENQKSPSQLLDFTLFMLFSPSCQTHHHEPLFAKQSIVGSSHPYPFPFPFIELFLMNKRVFMHSVSPSPSAALEFLFTYMHLIASTKTAEIREGFCQIAALPLKN